MTISVIGTTDSIQVVLDAAPATNQLPCTVSYVDQGASIGGNSINTNGTTAVTLVASPGSGISRVVGAMSIPNADTATRIVTVSRVVSGTPFRIVRMTLLAGYQLFYDNNGGWRVLDANGNFLEAVTVGSGTLTANQGTAAAIAGSWPVEVTDGTNILGTSAHPIRIDPTGTTTQPVSGTLTTTPPSNASTNITQFGGVAISTGTGASGTGIPRVTVSNDSVISATQSGVWNTYPAPLNLSSTLTLTTTTASVFGASISFTKLRFCKVDLFNYINSASCFLTIKDGSGTQISQILIPIYATASTSYNVWFSDLLNNAINNTSAGLSIQINAAPTSGSIAVQLGWSN